MSYSVSSVLSGRKLQRGEDKMESYLTVRGAYGRDYTSKAKALAAWNSNLDFQIVSTGRYINKADAERYNAKVMIRYNRDTMIFQVR